jgi:Tfp pilus assembly protein PilO
MTGRDRMVLIVIVLLALIGAGWVLVVSPERKKANSLDAQVTAAQSALSTAEGKLADAKSDESKYASAYASVVSLGKAVPASQEVPSLIYQLSQATGERDVQFNSISAGGGTGAAPSASATATAAAAAGFTEMPFQFGFTGGFFDLERLFRELTSFTNHSSGGGLEVSGRLLTIQSVKLTPEATSGGGATTNLEGAITATAYVLPASQGLTDGATASSPTSASSTSSTSTSTPAVVKVTP